MDKKLMWAIISTDICNAVCIVSFAVLAVAFDRWWIALFGLLGISTLKLKQTDKQKEDDSK